MNKNLQIKYDALLQSSTKLNFVVTQFLIKATAIADKISQHFLNKKNNNKDQLRNKLVHSNDDYDLLAYKDSLMQRFICCYENTQNFLSEYLIEIFSIKSDSPENIFQNSFKNNLITKKEAELLIKLSKDFDNISKNRSEVSDELIQYCILMCNIIHRFKK